jgi:cell division protein FtsB
VEQLVIERETNMQNDDVAQLATDLDKAPTGEAIIQRLLTAQVKLHRENAQMAAENAAIKATLDNLVDQIALLTALVDSHQHAIELMTRQGGIVQ